MIVLVARHVERDGRLFDIVPRSLAAGRIVGVYV